METIHEMVDNYPAWVRFAGSTSDIRGIVAGGHRAILIGIEGATPSRTPSRSSGASTSSARAT